ncbi:MAG: zinc ABC transporter substrate-binding protein [Ardenticatenaceae bacterium]|nr:zinc ABC transporter substrate-binding protein [Ardenticatenaceae bacterium]
MNQIYRLLLIIGFMTGLIITTGCTSDAANKPGTDQDADTSILTIPDLTAVAQNGAKLQVVATTSIIGDVVANVGGDAIELTVLMAPGQDPHSYQPGAAELTAVARANVIFVNGWNLEEGLLDDLEAIGENTPIIPISANITPLTLNADEEGDHDDEADHDHTGADPHVWFSIQNVEQWTKNVSDVLSTLDPDNATIYANNAAQYLTALAELEQYTNSQLAAIPAEQRVLVTNHDALGYFAHDYDFTVLGTVIPGRSTLAEPAAADLTALISVMQAKNVCTIFTESSVSDTLANTVATELDTCDTVQVLPLYTGALGSAGSGADTYIDMFRSNVDTIVTGLVR